MSPHYDVIIIGTGAGGGSLLNRIAPSGKRILVLERGPFLPREKDNWSYHGSFKYYSSETMYNKAGGEIHPGFCYYVGGNTKVYGAALFRLRELDFEKFRHKDGFSPEWPLKYADFEPYYDQAEELYEVHGKAGEDPTEPPRKKDYPFPPLSHEPRIKEVFEILKARGMKPYPAPMGIRINEALMHLSPCIRCDTCDGYPCMAHAKSDADVLAVRPVMREPSITLLTEAKVLRLHTSASGREVTGVVAEAIQVAQTLARALGTAMPFWYALTFLLSLAATFVAQAMWSTSWLMALGSAALSAAMIVYSVLLPVPSTTRLPAGSRIPCRPTGASCVGVGTCFTPSESLFWWLR